MGYAVTGIALSEALGKVRDAAGVLFAADPSVRSVGVGEAQTGFCFFAVRNSKAPIAYSAKITRPLPTMLDGIPVQILDSQADPSSLARVPHSGPASPGVGSLIPEQQQLRPLVCGLQIQNYDNDVRTREIAKGYLIVGTLGCFVKLPGGAIAILSNNHVVAGENAGKKNQDRIQQPGGATFNSSMHVATLTDFVQLKSSPAGASIAAGTVVLNEVDAGVAAIKDGIVYSQSYVSPRTAAPPSGVAAASTGDVVHKVGRTSGLTYGTIKQIGVVVGPVAYATVGCWFQNSFIIEGNNGTTFSDHGDSGSAIVRDDGMVVGLLYAGNGTQTYACPIDPVLTGLHLVLDPSKIT